MGEAAGVRTTCPYCGVGCGIIATPCDDGSVSIAGDPAHPANFGRLCSKGSALGETLGASGRLLHPEIDGRRAGWDEALDLVAQRFLATIREHGPDAVAFYVSGQLLTEDYYVANKLMKGFFGSANIDTNSRLCMASSVAGHKRAFGADIVPASYEDLELADLVVLVGSNLAWCHPVLFQRLRAAKERRGTRVVVIDPRATATAEIADLRLAIAPGADVALFNGLLAHLADGGHLDEAYIGAHTQGFEAALAEARRLSNGDIARLTGLARDDIANFYALFAATDRVVTVFSQGVNQSSAGTDKVNAIINCHLATGRIGKPGAAPFSVTGQPNAMGGREVGGLANMLAAHMEIADADHRRLVQEFWRAPAIPDRPGLKAVDMFRAVADGRIKALWIMATNPVVSLPEADLVAQALARCPFVVVSDVVRSTDTTRHAHVLLPAAAWGEKDGTVTNSERRISRQRPFLPLPGDAQPDWWIVTQVARRAGFSEAFPYQDAATIFAEHARLSAAGNDGTRDFDLGAHSSIDAEAYAALAPFQWPARGGDTRRKADRSRRAQKAAASRSSKAAAALTPTDAGVASTRFFAEGGFFTPDRRARFVATPFRPAVAAASAAFPFVLNTGRIRDQWHTMTRTGLAPRLSAHLAEPFAEIHPEDAAAHGIREADLVEVTTRHGRAVVRALLSSAQRRGSVFLPMHWTDQLASRARTDALVAAVCDPVSGQPELKASVARIARFDAAWYGFAVVAEEPPSITTDYWAKSRTRGGWRLELAGRTLPADWLHFARGLIGAGRDDVEILAYDDEATGRHRFAAYDGERLLGAVFIAREPVAVSRTWAAGQLALAPAGPNARHGLLAGRPGAEMKDPGPIVCACFEVGLNTIVEAITGARCLSVEAIGKHLRAGTNCGSCRSEIARVLAARTLQAAG
jgi:assimilatory nitrate reductase catalytic subunit